MENVPDLLAKKHWHHFQSFKDTVEAEGYHIAVKYWEWQIMELPNQDFVL